MRGCGAERSSLGQSPALIHPAPLPYSMLASDIHGSGSVSRCVKRKHRVSFLATKVSLEWNIQCQYINDLIFLWNRENCNEQFWIYESNQFYILKNKNWPLSLITHFFISFPENSAVIPWVKICPLRLYLSSGWLFSTAFYNDGKQFYDMLISHVSN